ncbi:hypothetical protein [Mangrovibacter plantisponsor]|uniref:Uncharacterized protein n=1 Tax=Mangrovibacter plantisponsor TaxID=451513 RepID=A0A317PTF1_9ENTR|nr:hypothetical protein [Mangrovibacter plantisponsor]PWW04962.1 hypothetical protein DES37_11458 [Mangrovibacter plantisponsor]
MKIIEEHKFYSNDMDKEEQDKEIWVDGKLTYTIHDGLENEDTDQLSPFEDQQVLQTLFFTDKGTVQHNHEDDSFYFRLADDVTMASYVDGELMPEDPDGKFNDFITFANGVSTK